MHAARNRRRGFTLVEVGIATFIIVIIAFAGFAYYSTARVQEIEEWHEQNALYLCEREAEAWHASKFAELNGFGPSDSGDANWLPYGYSFGDPDPDWNTTGRYKPVTLNGFNYRIRAQNLYNTATPSSSPTNCFWQETWNNGTGDLEYAYRRIRITVQWGTFTGNDATKSMFQETRIAR